jgi:hypothetical protein
MYVRYNHGNKSKSHKHEASLIHNISKHRMKCHIVGHTIGITLRRFSEVVMEISNFSMKLDH